MLRDNKRAVNISSCIFIIICVVVFPGKDAVSGPTPDCGSAGLHLVEDSRSLEGGASMPARPIGGSGDTISLPAVPRTGEVSIEEAIWRRRSIRSYKRDVPGLDVISRLLWAAQGITEKEYGLRSAPSAGATYPLEVFVATGEYVARYMPGRHRLAVLMRKDVRASLADGALGQSCVEDAPVVFVFTAEVSRTARVYDDRAGLYIHIEVGCASENLMLQAAALGLGSVAVGAFYEDDIKKVLDLPRGWEPYLIVPVGVPAE